MDKTLFNTTELLKYFQVFRVLTRIFVGFTFLFFFCFKLEINQNLFLIRYILGFIKKTNLHPTLIIRTDSF